MAGAAGHGFPAATKRYDLTEQGARLKDTRPVADPRYEVCAATMEALLWQAGAFGLLAPLVVLQYEPQPYAASEKVRLGALAWDDTVHVAEMGTTSSWGWVTITRNAAGDYSFEFPATAPDAFGTAQAITLTRVQAQACGLDGVAGVIG